MPEPVAMPDAPSLYAWMEYADGDWGITMVAGVKMGTLTLEGTVLLCARHPQSAAAMKPFAAAHAKVSGNRIALRRYAYAETIESLKER